MKREEVRARIQEIGIIPSVRVPSAEEAKFAAEAVMRAGIPIAEITMTVPGAIEVISYLAKKVPEMIVGAGTLMDRETAQRCLDVGARFLTSPGLVVEVVEFAKKHEVAVLPGALTPTEVIAAWKAGGDLIKIFPCGQVGGDRYIRALKAPFPHLPLIAAGGVTQQTAAHFVLAGAAAIGIGSELIPREALHLKQEERIHELGRRFLAMVKDARRRTAVH